MNREAVRCRFSSTMVGHHVVSSCVRGAFLAALGGLPGACPAIASPFDMTLEARVGRADTNCPGAARHAAQSFHGLLLRFQTVSYCCRIALPRRTATGQCD